MIQQQKKAIVEGTTFEGEKVPEIHSLILRVQDLNQSVDWWNSAMILALVLAALAAIAVVVTTRIALARAKQLADAQAELIQLKDSQLALDLKDKDVKIAEAGEKAAAARQTAEGFRLDIAKANERAAQATLELAKIKTPRSLSSDQRKKISETLRGFAGKQFDVALNVEPEPQGLLLQIEDALKAAAWVEIDWKGGGDIAEISFTRKDRPMAGIVVVSGVIIQMHPDQVSELGTAAKTLASALNEEGIASEAQLGLGIPNNNAKAIHILIGKKPQ